MSGFGGNANVAKLQITHVLGNKIKTYIEMARLLLYNEEISVFDEESDSQPRSSDFGLKIEGDLPMRTQRTSILVSVGPREKGI